MRRPFNILAFITMAIAAFSCSTTRVLQDGEYRLAKNSITITNDEEFNENSLSPYLKQQPNRYFVFGWNPFLNVYNWSNGKGKAWDKFVSKIGVAPVVYESSMVDESIENISDRLEYLGYYGSSIESSIRVKKKRVYVDYNVELGKQIPIKDIEIILPEGGTFPEDFMADTSNMLVQPGAYLSEYELEQESASSAARMRNLGYYTFDKSNFTFEADTLSVPDSALLKMEIRESGRNVNTSELSGFRKFYFRNVTMSYPKSLKIKDKVLRELNTVKPGDLYNTDKVNDSYSRLSSLRMFNSVNIDITQVDSTGLACNIYLSPSKMQGFKVNLEASTNSTGLFGISPQFSYYHKNIFRGGEWFNLSFMGNFQFKFNDDIRSNEFGVSSGISFPRFLLLPHKYFTGAIPRTDINLSYNYQNRPEYTRNIISTSYGYNGNVDNRFFYQVYPLQLNIVRLFDMDENFYKSLENDPFFRNAYQDHFDLGSGGTLYYTTNSSSNPKTTYSYARLQLDVAGNMLSAFKGLMDRNENGAGMIWNTPFSQFVRTELTLGKTWVMGKDSDHAIATRLVAGAGHAYGNSDALPFEKHFYGGGANSLRGWQARTVGPGTSPMDNTFVIPNQTGDMKLEANIEYRFDMFSIVEGALFLDAGNIWTLKDDTSSDSQSSLFRWKTIGESLAVNWGLGMRLDVEFLLLRLDLGMRLHDPARDNRWVGPAQWFQKNGFALHFGVGYPF